jgi:hypothetical protein
MGQRRKGLERKYLWNIEGHGRNQPRIPVRDNTAKNLD